jgi:D-glycero-alpha-D-manno-heptose-7-phosphate kinase
LAGGGTDLAAFYERDHGAVLSTTIDKYIYVTVKRHGEVFNERIRLNYYKSEQVQAVEEIENNIARECLRFLQIEPPIYISTVGDLPVASGLGGSSSFAVGLLNALHAFRGERVSAGQLAEEACHIEIDILKEPIGKQDQYAAAVGGFNFFRFKPGGSVTVEPHRVTGRTLTDVFEHFQMFWTGHQREASSVLTEQKDRTPEKFESLMQMRDCAYELQSLLAAGPCDMEVVGGILDRSWQLKRGLASRISNDQIDTWYARAREAGAIGGKLCGAGGGGFLLLVAAPDRQQMVNRSLADLKQVPVGPEVQGSQVLLLE